MNETLPFFDHFPYLGIPLLLILGTLGLPFPEDTILMLSGFLIAQGVMRSAPAFLIIYPTVLMTDFLLYCSGKRYGRKVVDHHRFQKVISPPRLHTIETKFKKWGIWVIFFGRHLLGLRAQLFLVAGVMRMSPIKFVITDAVSALVTIGIMGSIGYVGGERFTGLGENLSRIRYIATILSVVIVLGGIFFMYFKDKRKTTTRTRGS